MFVTFTSALTKKSLYVRPECVVALEHAPMNFVVPECTRVYFGAGTLYVVEPIERVLAIIEKTLSPKTTSPHDARPTVVSGRANPELATFTHDIGGSKLSVDPWKVRGIKVDWNYGSDNSRRTVIETTEGSYHICETVEAATAEVSRAKLFRTEPAEPSHQPE